jgi:hypothetical protein
LALPTPLAVAAAAAAFYSKYWQTKSTPRGKQKQSHHHIPHDDGVLKRTTVVTCIQNEQLKYALLASRMIPHAF